MKISWYFYRLRKMSFKEMLKRVVENVSITIAFCKYRNTKKWTYKRLAGNETRLELTSLPGIRLEYEDTNFDIYNYPFDLTKPLPWHFTETDTVQWPNTFYTRIKYRPGNPYGDIRINWELNRLQFLPPLALIDEVLARTIITDWLNKNPYLHGPSYISSMEVSLRWMSIYWAVCLFNKPLDENFEKK